MKELYDKAMKRKLLPTFAKIYAAARRATGDYVVFIAIRTAANWDELCANPNMYDYAAAFLNNIECFSLYDDYYAAREILDKEFNALCAALCDNRKAADAFYKDDEAKLDELYQYHRAAFNLVDAGYEAKRALLDKALMLKLRAIYEIQPLRRETRKAGVSLSTPFGETQTRN